MIAFNKITYLVVSAFLIIVVSFSIFSAEINSPSLNSNALNKERKAQLVHLIKQDCGSCHGMTLKGGLGPPLLPENMNKLPLEMIKNTILFGRPETAMPPWNSILSESEVIWISEKLQEGI